MPKANKTAKRSITRILLLVFIIIVVAFSAVIAVILNKTVLVKQPELNGTPEIGQWYRITPKGTKSSDNSEWHGLIKVGSANKVAVYFFGGGVSMRGPYGTT